MFKVDLAPWVSKKKLQAILRDNIIVIIINAIISVIVIEV